MSMDFLKNEIEVALRCADADLQGVLQRASAADKTDKQAARDTRKEIVRAQAALEKLVAKAEVVKELIGILNVADGNDCYENPKETEDALKLLRKYVEKLKE